MPSALGLVTIQSSAKNDLLKFPLMEQRRPPSLAICIRIDICRTVTLLHTTFPFKYMQHLSFPFNISTACRSGALSRGAQPIPVPLSYEHLSLYEQNHLSKVICVQAGSRGCWSPQIQTLQPLTNAFCLKTASEM